MRAIATALILSLAIACAEPSGTDSTNEDVSQSVDQSDVDASFFPIDVDDETAGVIIQLPAGDSKGVSLRAIHTAGVASGLGSNPVGLDRGFQDSGRIIAFRRVGNKVLIEQENWRYRASTDNPLEQKAVLDSFAASILWAGEAKKIHADGSFDVDIAGFLTSDVLDLRGWLKSAGQGDFSIAEDRSFADPQSVLAFPDNIEIDTVMTLTSAAPGSEVTATAADGRAPSLRIHHSFVRLPADGYEPRLADPRSGMIDVTFYDFSAPLDEPIVQKYAHRFRLQRIDPNVASGPVKKPIVFYVDAGAPEQVRNALVEGASWWAAAFEEAGFEDAFRVEVLPADIHPFDVRYNVVQWTHRQTRGWSYGGGVIDPRTGEMLKGHVILGSQRVRQDRMIFEGLAGAAASGSGGADDPVEIALARIRQLSAHEVGHPLGFAHNFAASQNDRASVMDYPAPLVRPTQTGGLDLSGAYSTGIGDWDKFTVKWLYSEFPDDVNERDALETITRDAYGAGLKFVADREGRSVGAAHPAGSVWDNGDDPVAMLRETMTVREIALQNFGLGAIQDGEPVSTLRSVIVPIYMYHRYQTAAAAKLIGGYEFDYALKGDAREGGDPVPASRQRAALSALLETLDPAVLDLPDETLNLLTPAAISYSSFKTAETFAGDTGPMFDLLSASDAAGSITIKALLHPNRLARIIETARRDQDALDMEELLRAIEGQVFATTTGRYAEVQRVLQTRYVSTLISVGRDARMDGAIAIQPSVSARIDAYLKGLQSRVAPGLLDRNSPAAAHREWLAARIDQHLTRPASPATATSPAAEIPPGSPIGEACWHCDSIQ